MFTSYNYTDEKAITVPAYIMRVRLARLVGYLRIPDVNDVSILLIIHDVDKKSIYCISMLCCVF